MRFLLIYYYVIDVGKNKLVSRYRFSRILLDNN